MIPTINLFPAVLLAGPPHTGKSALAYNLSIHLKESQTPFILLRTTPDGEGDWFLEAEKSVGIALRQKKHFTLQLVQRAERAIQQRHLPMLVDVGGKPQGQQFRILHACTHVILLYNTDAERTQWQAWLDETSLIPIASLRSDLHGNDEIIASDGLLQGVISGLDRFQPRMGVMFEQLLQRVQGIFTYPPAQLRTRHLSLAPENAQTIVVPDLAQRLGVPLTERGYWWELQHLVQVRQLLPRGRPLALYGRGPAWLYATIAIHALPSRFYLFDARHYGWMQPPRIILDSARADPDIALTLQPETAGVVRLKMTLKERFLTPHPAHLPPLPPAAAVIIDGKAPMWLYAALARALARRGHHVSLYDPRLETPVHVG